MTERASRAPRDPRFTLRREFTGQAKPMWVIRFCGTWLGLQCVTRAEARKARRGAISARATAAPAPVPEKGA